VTGASKEILEQKVKPAVIQFLVPRVTGPLWQRHGQQDALTE
jgi:hypothetical protein